MKRKARTLGSILLAVVMIVTLLPAAAFAEEEAPAAGETAVVTGSAEEDEKEENIENPEVIEGEEEKEEEEKEIPLLKGAMLRSGTTYNLWVNGVQVTSANKGNILNATNTDGTPKAEFVPGQNGAAGTLKLNNAVFDGVYNNCGILSKDDLNIELTGKSIIDLSTIDRSAGVHTWVGKTITFTGTGSLETMGKSAGIYNDHGTIKIESGTITAKGVGYGFGVYNLGDWGGALIINGGSLTAETGYSWGIFNQSGSITVNGGTLHASGPDNSIAGAGTISYDETKVGITVPAGGKLSEDNKKILTSDGATVTDAVIEPAYKVNIADGMANGTVTADKPAVSKAKVDGGEEIIVKLTATPAEGYAVGEINANNGAVTLTKNDDGTYSFTMPADDVTITAAFKKVTIVDYEIVQLPYNTNVVQGGTLDTRGLQVRLIYSDGSSKMAEEYYPADTWLIPGITTVIDVNCSVDGDNYAVPIPITVLGLYYITIADTENGTVTTAPEGSAAERTEVTVTAAPASGYALDTLTVTGDNSGGEITVTNGKFTMPAENVTITATFVKGYPLWVNGEQVKEKNAENILGDEAKSAVYDPASGTLKLKNAAITADNDYGIKYDMPLTIELTGNNTITGSRDGIDAQNGKPLTFTGTGSLGINSDSFGIYASGSKVTVDGVSITVISNSIGIIMSDGNLTVKDGGSLELTTTDGTGIYVKSIIVDDGTITVSSEKEYDGISLYNNGSINLIKGSITSNAGKEGIHAGNCAITVEKDGNLTVTSVNNMGIMLGGGSLTIRGGRVDIQSKGSYRDAINASYAAITVEGGKLIVTSESRYGIVLNYGTLTAKGGTITVEGGDKAIRFNGEGKVKLENDSKIVTPEWYADSEETEFKNDIMEEEDGTTPAKKVVITKYYDASVDDSVQNGTITIEPEGNVSEGDEVTVTVTPKPGYKVEKITVTDSQGNEIPVKDGKFIMPAGNVTVSATFKKDGGGASSGGGRSGSVSFILTYDANGGSEIKSESHSAGDNVTLDKTPVKDGYTFTGWYADKECTQKIESITMNSSKTVYAGWSDGAQPDAPLMAIKIGSTKYQLNGVDMEMDSAPFIDENDRTMLPVRVVANALGISDNDIAWDNETKTASFTRLDGKVVSCTVGSNIIRIGDEEVEIDTAPVIRNDRIFLPMRALFNAFNVSDEHIIWDGETKTVTITKEALEDIKALAEESPSEE